MFLGIGNIVALVCIIISIIFAIVAQPSDRPALVGAVGDICGLVVGRKSALG